MALIIGPPTPSKVTLATTDERLLAAATEHLRCLGQTHFTVRAVAAEFGMTHACVYRYFPSKVALLDAISGRWLHNVEVELDRIAGATNPADEKIGLLLNVLANVQREALIYEPNLFAVYLDATVSARPVVRRHRTRLRSLIQRIVEEGIAAKAFVISNRERAIAYIFDASYRFTHPLAIQQDAGVPRDLVKARFDAGILAIQKVLRTGTL